jgi:hypothetical protein
MQRQKVESSSISEIGYDEQFATLEIEFIDGKVYQYFDVPKAVHDELLRSESIGKYFTTNVRGEYRFARV